MSGSNQVSPAAAATANGARVAEKSASQHRLSIESHDGSARQKLRLSFRRLPDGAPQTVTGREAQTLALLVARGSEGFTSGEASPLGWGRRTSAYVHDLRRQGVSIVTALECAPDGARVGRYRLACDVELIGSDA